MMMMIFFRDHKEELWSLLAIDTVALAYQTYHHVSTGMASKVPARKSDDGRLCRENLDVYIGSMVIREKGVNKEVRM